MISHVDQFCAGFSRGDAISNEALILRDHIRRLGFHSEIYCEQFTDRDAHQVLHYKRYHRRKKSILIYHHSFHTGILARLRDYPARKILVFHNVTPGSHVEPYNPELARTLALARDNLAELSDVFETVLCDSRFNADELHPLGFPDATVMPVALDFDVLKKDPDPERLRFLDDGRINILFVGRIFPNKRHQDLLKAFHFFRKIRPDSRLLCVGAFHPGVRLYTMELGNLVGELGLAGQAIFTGMVSLEEILACYRKSHLFFSMSEHEGFLVPLPESMFFRLPILAYASSAIPETLGESGALFHRKDFALVAELMAEIVESPSLREAIIDGQNKRLEEFRPEKSLAIFDRTLRRMIAGA